jgi:hypothetical protein
MREIPKYVPAWLFICSLLFMLVTLAHSLAIVVRDDTTYDYGDFDTQFGDKGRQDNQNESEWDISGAGEAIGSLMLGLDLPFPFPLIIIIFNGFMLSIIAFCVSEIIKAWLPLV